MDPRNYLNDTYIFQFETLEYAPYQNVTGVGNILSGSFMSGNYSDTDGASRSYADTFMEVGQNLSVSLIIWLQDVSRSREIRGQVL